MSDQTLIAGIDEAGRGALAGPVVAAAVILPPLNVRGGAEGGGVTSEENILLKVSDSKQLSPKNRTILYAEIIRLCDVGIGIVGNQEIDRIGIKAANHKAMQIAVAKLKQTPTQLLIDGRDRYHFDIPSQDIVRGDQTIPAISAASIIAKVTRDEVMDQYDQQYTIFEFRKNRGYGSEHHLRLIQDETYTPIHRQCYDPLKTILTQGRLF